MITLAADIGGTSVKVGLIEDARVLARERVPIAVRSRLEPLLDSLAQRWRGMLTGAGRDPHEAAAVALAFAGVVDARSCRVVSTNEKFTDAPSLDLRQWAQETMQLPLWIDNDARVALIGEWRAGAGRGVDDLVMMTLGTGIGGAAVVEGRVLRGSHGLGGMFGGHLTLNIDGRACTCGNIGCAEAEASTDRLPEIVSALAQGHGIDPPASWAADPALDYAVVFERADTGDRLAKAVRDRSLAVWSAATVNLIHAYAPRRVVIGGGIARGAPWIIDTIQKHVDRHAWAPWGAVEIRPAALGDDAAVIGSEFLPQLQAHDQETKA